MKDEIKEAIETMSCSDIHFLPIASSEAIKTALAALKTMEWVDKAVEEKTEPYALFQMVRCKFNSFLKG